MLIFDYIVALYLHKHSINELLINRTRPVTKQGVTHQLDGAFVYPLVTSRLTSKFGLRTHPIKQYTSYHKGIDLAATKGTQIRTVRAGVVIFAGEYEKLGNMVAVKHPDGLVTRYAHCDSYRVSAGDVLIEGEIIAEVGSTGLSTGDHLHFETLLEGKHYNPKEIFPDL